MNGTVTVTDGANEDREATQVPKRSASNQGVPFEMLGTTITISKNNSSPVSSMSSPRSSRTDMESVAETDPRDSPKAQHNSRSRRSSVQRLQMIRQWGEAEEGVMMPQSVVKMADVRRKTTMGSQSSMEDHNAKPGSASSAQRSTVVETTESVDREVDGKRETEGSVSVTSRSWEKISTPQISAVEDELQRCPALCDKAWPASSGDFSPGGSRVAVADGVPTVIIVNEEEEPHPSHCIADEESEIDLENARQEQQQNSTRGDLTIPGKHDKISRQSSSGIRLTYSTTPFVEGCRNMEVVPETRLRLRCARAAKSMQPGTTNGAKERNSPMASESMGVSGENREKMGGGDLGEVVVPKLDDRDRRRGSLGLEEGCEVPKKPEHSLVGSRSTMQTHDREGAGALPIGAGGCGQKHNGVSAQRQPFDTKEEARKEGIEIEGERVNGTGTRKAPDNDVEREGTERQLVDEPESFPPPRALKTPPEKTPYFNEATVGSVGGTLSCDHVAGKVEAEFGSSGRWSAPVREGIPTKVFGGNCRHDSVTKPSTIPEEPLTGEDSKSSPVSRAGRLIGPTVAVWKWGESISGLDCVKLEGIANIFDGVDDWDFGKRCDKAAPRPPEASITPLEQSSSALETYADRSEETPAAMAPVLSLACGHGHAALLLSNGGLATIGWGDHSQIEYGHCEWGIHEADPVAVHFIDFGDEEASHSHNGPQNVCCSFENNLPEENPHEIETSPLQGVGFEKHPNCVKGGRRWSKGSPSLPRGAGLMRVDVRGVACGRSHTAAFDWSGLVWTWGAGDDGALGHGDRKSSNVPRRVSTLVDVVVEGVACGDGHTLVFGLQKSTRFEERNHRDLFPADSPVVVYRWGFIHFNRSVIVTGVHMSQGSSPPTDAHRAVKLSEMQPEGRTLLRPTVVESLAGLKIVQISCGARHSCAVDGSGRCYTSGCNLSGQLGRQPPIFETSASVSHHNRRRVHVATSRGCEDEGPREGGGSGGNVNECSMVIDASCLSGPNSGNGRMVDVPHEPGGVDHVLEHEGEGGDGFGGIGLGERQDECGFEGYTSIACGGSHTLGLTSRRELWSWGDNHRGQLGHGDFMGRSTPTRVSEVKDVRSIAAGDETSAATTIAGIVLLWGCNSKGRLGLSLNDDVTPNPTVSPSLSGLGILQVGLGGTYGLCLSSRKPENTVHLPMMAEGSQSERDPGSTASLSCSPTCPAVEPRLPEVFFGSKQLASKKVGSSFPASRNPRSTDSGGDKGACRGRNGSETGGIPGGFIARSAADSGGSEDASRSGDAVLEGRKGRHIWPSTVTAEGKKPGLALVTKRDQRRIEQAVPPAPCRPKERGMHRRYSPAPKKPRCGSKSSHIPRGYKGRLTVPDFSKQNRANHTVAANHGQALMTTAQSPGPSLRMVVTSSQDESSLRQAHADTTRMNAEKGAPGASRVTLRPVRPSPSASPSGKKRSIKGCGRYTRKSHRVSAESSASRVTVKDRRLKRELEGRLPDNYVFVFDNSLEPCCVKGATSNAGPGPGPGPGPGSGNSREELAVGDAATTWDVVTRKNHQQPPLLLKPSIRESPRVRNGHERFNAGDRLTIKGTGVVPTEQRLLSSPADARLMASSIAAWVSASARTAEGKPKPFCALDNVWASDPTLHMFSNNRGSREHSLPSPLLVTANAGPTGAGVSSPFPMAKTALPPLPDSRNRVGNVGRNGVLNMTSSLPGNVWSSPSMSTRGAIEDQNSAPRWDDEKTDASGSGQPRSREETLRATSSSNRSGVAGACGNEIRASPAALAAPAEDLSTVEGSYFSRLWVEIPPRDNNSNTNQVRETRSAAMQCEDAIKKDRDGAIGSVPDDTVQYLSTVEGCLFKSSTMDPIDENSSVKLPRESYAKSNIDGAEAAACTDAADTTATTVETAVKQPLLDDEVSQASRRDSTICQSFEMFSPRCSSARRISLGNPVLDKRNSSLSRERETTDHGGEMLCTLGPVEGSSEEKGLSSDKSDPQSKEREKEKSKKREKHKGALARIAVHLAFWR